MAQRECAGIWTSPAAFTHVLCVAQLSFIFFLSEAFVGLVGAALSVRLVLCPMIHLGIKCQIPQCLLLPLSCSHHSCHGLSMHFVYSVVVWWLFCSHRKEEKPPGGKWDKEGPAGFWHTQLRVAASLWHRAAAGWEMRHPWSQAASLRYCSDG